MNTLNVTVPQQLLLHPPPRNLNMRYSELLQHQHAKKQGGISSRLCQVTDRTVKTRVTIAASKCWTPIRAGTLKWGCLGDAGVLLQLLERLAC